MAANSIMNSAFKKIGVFGKKQRGIHRRRSLLADDDQVFLLKMERLLMQYAVQQQLHVQIGTYTRDDMSCLYYSLMTLLFWTLILEIDAVLVLSWLGDFGRKEMMQLLSLSPIMLNMRRRGMNYALSGIF